MKPRAWWHLWHWKKYQKISCTQNHHISIWWSFKRSGVVPLRVRCSPVLSSLSQSCHWSPGLVPVQWRVNVGQADWGDGGEEGWRSVSSDETSPDGAEQCTDEGCGEVQWAETTRSWAPCSHACNQNQQSSSWRIWNTPPIKRRKPALYCAIP